LDQKPLINHVTNGGALADSLVSFLLNLSSKTDISPKGLINAINFLFDALNINESRVFLAKVFKTC
jgi:hypothetical protein